MLELKRISDRILQIIEYLNNLFTIRISKFSLEFKQRGWLSFTHKMNLSGIPPLSRKWKSHLLLFQRQLRYWKVFELSNIWTFFPFLAPKCRSELEWSFSLYLNYRESTLARRKIYRAYSMFHSNKSGYALLVSVCEENTLDIGQFILLSSPLFSYAIRIRASMI